MGAMNVKRNNRVDQRVGTVGVGSWGIAGLLLPALLVLGGYQLSKAQEPDGQACGAARRYPGLGALPVSGTVHRRPDEV